MSAGWVALLVATPGVSLEGHAVLVAALEAEGATVDVVSLPCAGDSDTLSAALVRAAARQAQPPVVVAHGLGATLALMAGPALKAERLVLLGPVLGPPQTDAVRWLAEQSPPPMVDLMVPLTWRDVDLHGLLLGSRRPPLTCISSRLAREALGWVRAGEVPLALEAVQAPVWIGVGLLDELAPPEVVVPLSRALPGRELVRLGITRMDPRDFGHLDLLVDPIPARVAARAAAP